MYHFSVSHILFCMMLYQQSPVVYLQTLTLTVETSPLRSGNKVILKCLYSGPTCCTDDLRVWTRDGTDIMSNGVASDNNKYQEIRNDTNLHFNMEILDLEDTDFDKPFVCKYNFLTSNAVTLTKDDTYESLKNDSCSIDNERSDGDKVNVKGTVHIGKAAPLPLFYAFYGEDNLTSGLSVVRENYDTYYYNTNVTFKGVDCRNHNGEMFIVTAVTGTYRKKICEINLCECPKCFWICFSTNSIFGIIGIIISIVYCCRFCGEECEKQKSRKMAALYGIITLIPSLIVGLSMGLYGCICNESLFWLFTLLISIVCSFVAIIIIDRIFYKIDWSDFKENKIKLVIGLFGGIAIFMIHDNLKKANSGKKITSKQEEAKAVAL